jgi:predicted nucleotidyltransferase
MNIQNKRDEIRDIAARHGARNVRLFGSAARGDERSESDLELLVDMEPERSLLDLVAWTGARRLLLRKVDVVTSARLHPTIRERVAADARPRRWRRCVYHAIGDGQSLALSAAVATIVTTPWRRGQSRTPAIVPRNSWGQEG